MEREPKTLQEAIKYFSSPENCINYLVARRPEWKDGVTCPTCGSEKVSFLKNQYRWQCSSRHPKRQFSVKVGTIFEDSPLGLDKWLPCVWLITNCKNGVSSWEIHRALGVSQKTAWFMLHRVRLAQQGRDGGKLSGEIEADETYIGGLARNMHSRRRNKMFRNGSLDTKTIVMGLLERHPEKGKSKVRLKVLPTASKITLGTAVLESVEQGAKLYTDEHAGYKSVGQFYEHEFINHAETYAEGAVHTNGLENFWSCLKRGLKGTYVSVEPFHMFRYLDEQAFRFNNRKLNDKQRFDIAVRQIVGKRLTYKELTGKEGETTEEF